VPVTPQQTDLADLESGERDKALIAGLVPAQTGYENTAVAIERHSTDRHSARLAGRRR
jgi:hypothetical protein